MNRRTLFLGLAPLTSFALAVACSGEKTQTGPAGADADGDTLVDDLGSFVDQNGDGQADMVDLNGDGKLDGWAVDINGDGKIDGVALDSDCDGLFESIDTDGDGLPNLVTGKFDPGPSCLNSGAGGTGNTTGGTGNTTGGTGNTTGGTGNTTGGTGTTTGGTGNTTGGTGNTTGGTGNTTGGTGSVGLGNAQYQGTGNSTDRYAEAEVFRNGMGYRFIANGWGCNWQNHSISWKGTSFTVASLNGSQGGSGCQYGEYSPAGYPTMFCGYYSEKQSPGMCGLPAAISSVSTLKTGWRWSAGGGQQYNAAWDIWIGNGNSLSAYLMLWLRDPPGQQPAGAAATSGATVPGLPGTWSIWTGSVNGKPIVNYVRAEGQDLNELEFDVKALYQDAINRNYNLPGSHFMAVAIGFEVWNGPVQNLVTDDFYVDVK